MKESVMRPSARALGRREPAPESGANDPPIASIEDAEAVLADMAQAFSTILRSDDTPAGTEADADRQSLAEKQRWKAEARYRSLVEQIPAVTFMAALDEDVHEFYVSPQIEALLGFSQEEWLSNPFLWFRQLHPDDRERCHLEFARGCRTGGPFRAEFRALTRDGRIVWVRGEARVVRDEHGSPHFIQGIGYDITESKRAEEAVRASAEQIEASLREKEVLLEEIHHRVKNNLQVISSLLRLQSAHVRDRATLEMFKESGNRIRSMALVHEKLYQSPDLSRLDFTDYLRSLTDLLVRSYQAETSRVTLRTTVEDVRLGIDAAVPLGLIVNELVSNCLKYAYPPGCRGEVRVELRPEDPERYLLCVADDGVGLPAGFDPRTTDTLGMQLVCALTDQLCGTIELVARAGTEFRIHFPR
jgi:PAS domain S-box-containing protein